jgi:riboflavin kinase/FMN adenylyltransferase
MAKKTVVAIGVFDGVHRGHQKVLKEAVKIARRLGAKAFAVTFNPHPLFVTSPSNVPPSLISLEHRIKLIYGLNIDRCIVFNFTKDFAGMRPEIFLKDVLVKKINAGWVVVGEDFCFGKDRSADADFLAQQGKKLGFKVKKLRMLKYKNFLISSSLVRRLIRQGRLSLAEKLLARPVGILGTVVKGNSLGASIGFPTANINPHHEVVPPSGVYVVGVKIDNKRYKGVLNIGTRPTFYGRAKRDKEPTIEAHIFDFSKQIYGKIVEVLFLKRLRPEKKFIDKEALARQIKRDVQKAKEEICIFA